MSTQRCVRITVFGKQIEHDLYKDFCGLHIYQCKCSRAVTNPKKISDPDPNPNEISCRISDPDPIIHKNLCNK